MTEKEREMAEEIELSKYQITDPTLKLNLQEFEEKYKSLVKNW